METFPEVRELALGETIRSGVARARNVDHPVVVPIEACGRSPDGSWFAISEYVEGQRLCDWADEVGIPPIGHVVGLVRVLCNALIAAATQHVVHGALNPKSILVFEVPSPRRPGALSIRLLGLGVPHEVRGRTPRAPSLNFMAPEQWADLRPPPISSEGLGARTDVYSCGALLYYLCTSGVPFSGRSPEELAHEHATKEVVVPSRINPAIPSELDAVILKALEKSPADRFDSIAALRDALREVSLPRASSVSGVMPAARVPSTGAPRQVGAGCDSHRRSSAAAPPAPTPSTPAPPRRSGVFVQDRHVPSAPVAIPSAQDGPDAGTPFDLRVPHQSGAATPRPSQGPYLGGLPEGVVSSPSSSYRDSRPPQLKDLDASDRHGSTRPPPLSAFAPRASGDPQARQADPQARQAASVLPPPLSGFAPRSTAAPEIGRIASAPLLTPATETANDRPTPSLSPGPFGLGIGRAWQLVQASLLGPEREMLERRVMRRRLAVAVVALSSIVVGALAALLNASSTDGLQPHVQTVASGPSSGAPTAQPRAVAGTPVKRLATAPMAERSGVPMGTLAGGPSPSTASQESHRQEASPDAPKTALAPASLKAKAEVQTRAKAEVQTRAKAKARARPRAKLWRPRPRGRAVRRLAARTPRPPQVTAPAPNKMEPSPPPDGAPEASQKATADDPPAAALDPAPTGEVEPAGAPAAAPVEPSAAPRASRTDAANRPQPAPRRLAINTRIANLQLEGSPSTVGVARAVARVRGGFTACYRQAQQRGWAPHHGQATVEVVIDARGHAIRPRVAGTSSKDLSQCIAKVASRVKTRPEPGQARVKARWTVQYARK